MNTLAGSLPNAQANNDLMLKFKDAAMSITNLYRASQGSSKRAHGAGYAAALADVRAFVQSGLSGSGSSEIDIAALLDWCDARAEAMRVQDSDDDRDEPAARRRHDERDEPRGAHRRREHERRKENDGPVPAQRPRGSSTPSPPPVARSPPRSPPLLPLPLTSSPTLESRPIPIPLAGSKRRHVEIVTSIALPSPAAASTPTTSKAKRRRAGRPSASVPTLAALGTGLNSADTSMEVEMVEEGRERKRVARR